MLKPEGRFGPLLRASGWRGWFLLVKDRERYPRTLAGLHFVAFVMLKAPLKAYSTIVADLRCRTSPKLKLCAATLLACYRTYTVDFDVDPPGMDQRRPAATPTLRAIPAASVIGRVSHRGCRTYLPALPYR
jgi:hypothetical protein